MQRYREAPAKLRRALANLRERQVAAVLQLGDIINGNSTPEKTTEDLDIIAAILDEELVSSLRKASAPHSTILYFPKEKLVLEISFRLHLY